MIRSLSMCIFLCLIVNVLGSQSIADDKAVFERGFYWQKGKNTKDYKQRTPFTSFDSLLTISKDVIKITLEYRSGNLTSRINQFTNLTELEVRFYNVGVVLPSELWTMTQLKRLELDCWNYSPIEISNELENLVNLEDLSLDGIYLYKFPMAIIKLTKLKELTLMINKIKEIPSEIGKLKNLERLAILGNDMNELPKEIGKLTKLKKLYLQNNKLKTLPPEIGLLKNLVLCSPSGNKLDSLPIEFWNLTKMEDLNFYNCGLSYIPPQIGKMKNLIWLGLNHNDFKTIPKEIGKLTKLKSLYIEGNEFTSMPKEIANLKQLKLIDIRKNPWIEFPIELFGMTNLKNIYFDDRNVAEYNFPEELCKRLNYPARFIHKVPTSIAKHPLKFYLERSDIDSISKLYVQNKLNLSEFTLDRILDSVETKNPITAPFYFFLFNAVLEYANPGYGGCPGDLLNDGHDYRAAEMAGAFFKKDPIDFFARIKYGEYKHYYTYWKWSLLSGLNYHPNEKGEEGEDGLDVYFRTEGLKYQKDWKELKVFFEEHHEHQ